jgi:DNA-binding transcriptional ArsR family regulator
MDENVVVLEPGDERAQKIAKAMSSQTASDILRLLAENNKSMSEITDQLAIPLTTTKYHVENMLDAGLITIANTKYSVKGREVKIYSLSDQLVIVAPRQLNIRSMLLKYSSLLGMVIFGTLFVALVSPVLFGGETVFWGETVMPAATPVPSPSGFRTMMVSNNAIAATNAGQLDPALAFFLGGAMVIGVLLCYEIYLWKKEKRR